MRVELKITGLDALAAKLHNAAKTLEDAIGREMYIFAEEVMTASKLIVPVETGTLMNTGHVELPRMHEGSVLVQMGYGGPAAPYALYVHEALEGAIPPSPNWSWTKKVARGGQIAWTRPGSGPKYLENPLKERQDQLPGRVKKAVLATLKGA